MKTEGFIRVSIDMIKELLDKNEKTFGSIELDNNFNDDSTEMLLFKQLWQIGVRWKSCILLIENNHNIGLIILLRSIYESQRTLEYILKDTTKTRPKLLARQLNYVIEELKSVDIEHFISRSEINLMAIMEMFKLTEISDLVLEKFDNDKWRKFNWFKLFNEGNNFSEMTRLLDSEAQQFGDHLYRSLSIVTHANNTVISKVISIESPFEEEISQRTLIYLFTVLGDFELVTEMFITQHYSSYLDSWKQDGRLGLVIQTFIKLLFDNDFTEKNLEDVIKNFEEEVSRFDI